MILMGRFTVHQNDHQKVSCLIKTDGNETTLNNLLPIFVLPFFFLISSIHQLVWFILAPHASLSTCLSDLLALIHLTAFIIISSSK